MTKIFITTPTVRNMKGIGGTSGKPYDINFQTGHAYTVGEDGVVAEIPDKFEFMLASGQLPYPRGNYTLAPSAVQVGRDGKLIVIPRLIAVPVAVASK